MYDVLEIERNPCFTGEWSFLNLRISFDSSERIFTARGRG